MKSIRLLPIVVAAAGALLALKTVGLVSEGGYVLGRTALAQDVPTIEDGNPTIVDAIPTLGERSTGPARPTPPAPSGETGGDPSLPRVSNLLRCADLPGPQAGSLRDLGTALFGEDCLADGDAIPIHLDSSGRPVPLETDAAGVLTERALLERLAERRAELEAYGAELAMREALVAAAERRMEERVAALEALEARVAALLEESEAAEETLIAPLVAMYEQMRPRDAAAIFEALDPGVLVAVVRAMPPRRMAPILAAMSPARAQELTVRLAAATPRPPDPVAAGGLDALPQIVGR